MKNLPSKFKYKARGASKKLTACTIHARNILKHN